MATQRLKQLRELMQQKSIDAVIIPTNDPHQSEYPPTHWEGREWISGFTGSAGIAVVTQTKAGVWTDSRYFLQAETELKETGFTLHKVHDRSVPQHLKWLTTELEHEATVAIDGMVCSVLQFQQIEKHLIEINPTIVTNEDVLDQVWSDRPPLPTSHVFDHDVKYAGVSRMDKIQTIREAMEEVGAQHHLVTKLDDLAWIFNFRGSDVEYNPVVVCYAVISQDAATLFIDDSRVDPQLLAQLETEEITIEPYGDILKFLNTMDEDETILVEKSSTPLNLKKGINGKLIYGKCPSTHLKGIKNETEISFWTETMVKDGVALANAFYHLEQTLKSGKGIFESDFANVIAKQRSQQEGYQGESFGAIVGYKGNGAIIHYKPEAGKDKVIENNGILLCDSGGQYIDGTTDITRTFSLDGNPTLEQKRHFTLVLKGTIALSRAKFPAGTNGAQLDILARQFLWENGLNYGHGTGHGVGFFLNVHEGPHGISSPKSSAGLTTIEPGMVVTIEPGYYLDHQYGIRVENMVVAVQDEDEGFLSFDTMTLYPIDIRLIDEAIFTKTEKAWLNQYHYAVFKRISPHLKDMDLRSWFELRCRPMN